MLVHIRARFRLLIASAAFVAFLSATTFALAAQPTKITVGLKLASANTLTVTVQSAKAKCRKGRLAVFYQKPLAGGGYSVLGSEYTNSKGEYTSGLLEESFYYVKVSPETKQGTRCAGDRSRVVKIKSK